METRAEIVLCYVRLWSFLLTMAVQASYIRAVAELLSRDPFTVKKRQQTPAERIEESYFRIKRSKKGYP